MPANLFLPVHKSNAAQLALKDMLTFRIANQRDGVSRSLWLGVLQFLTALTVLRSHVSTT